MKKVVLGIVAGVTVVGGMAGLVISSVKRLCAAKKYYEEAGKIVEKAEDLVYEANEILDRSQELADFLDDDLDDDDEEDDDIVEFPKGGK